MEKCIKNGYSVIRLLQEDVYMNKGNWKKKFLKSLNDINNSEILYIRYINPLQKNKGIYDKHKQEMLTTDLF